MSNVIRNAAPGAWRNLPPLGTRAWEVEWCNDIPTDENGDSDFDRAEYESRIVRTKGPAFALAKRMLPKDFIGEVRVTPVELSDPYGDKLPWTYLWEAVGDAEFVSK